MENVTQIPPVLLVKKKTGEVYENVNGHIFKNLTSGQEGEVTPEIAKKHLAMPVKLNILVSKNPAVLTLIRELGCSVVMGQEP